MVIRKEYRRDEYTNSTPATVTVCALSPISNDALVDSDGWYERYDNSGIYTYFENEEELFSLHCRHNRWLVERGFFDIDPATINFFKPSNVYFDKSAVMPLRDLEPKHIDCYFVLLNQSYKTISEDRQRTIRKALESGDRREIIDAFNDN